jgi:hypothetical protein
VETNGDKNDATRIVSQILRADDMFLAEIGRLTFLFSEIEDRLAHDALELSQFGSDKEDMNRDRASHNVQLRILEKRDYLKGVWVDLGRFYDLDLTRISTILDELGNLNRLRRAVVHGWIRWSVPDEEPVFVDSHGHSIPAFDVADVNLKVLNWMQEYNAEQARLLRGALQAYVSFADRLLRYPRLRPSAQALLRELKARAMNLAAD